MGVLFMNADSTAATTMITSIVSFGCGPHWRETKVIKGCSSARRFDARAEHHQGTSRDQGFVAEGRQQPDRIVCPAVLQRVGHGCECGQENDKNEQRGVVQPQAVGLEQRQCHEPQNQ